MRACYLAISVSFIKIPVSCFHFLGTPKLVRLSDTNNSGLISLRLFHGLHLYMVNGLVICTLALKSLASYR